MNLELQDGQGWDAVFEYENPPKKHVFGHLSQLLVLLERCATLGSGALLEDVCHYECVLQFNSLVLCFLRAATRCLMHL